ncbi:conserved protein of unknown function [Ruminococcaceae bacterium BL-4]|nr:conserved protein of unknown function [Ruminococcaceae bacterium BL-4]
MTWLVDNISWIKDILWILFTLVATLIAILTYRRARYTLLQPLRSEVVKRQTNMLMKLLEFVAGQKGEIYFKIDYMGIIACNAYKLLELTDYHFLDDDIRKKVEENIGGQIILTSSGYPKTFCAPTDPFYVDDSGAKDFCNYKKLIISEIKEGKGLVSLENLYLTKQHVLTVSTIEKYRDSPLMPQKIQIELSQLLCDISNNIRGPLFKELENFISEAIKMDSSEHSPLSIHYQAIYNRYLKYSKSHTELVEQITATIRSYLQVDAKWS